MLREEALAKEIEAILEPLVRSLCENPNECSINSIKGEQTFVFELRVAKPDLGTIIGKKGSMAASLRTLLNSLASRRGIRAVLEIVE